jgi:hypothetical protein
MVKPVKAEMPNFTLRYRLVEWKAYATRRDAARRCDRPKVMVWCGKVMGQLGEGMGLMKVKRKANCMSF